MKAEQQLADMGLALEEGAFPLDDDKEVKGIAVVIPDEGRHRCILVVRPGTSQPDRDLTAEWAISRIPRLLTDGPEVDGWQSRNDGGWQMYLRVTYLPDFA